MTRGGIAFGALGHDIRSCADPDAKQRPADGLLALIARMDRQGREISERIDRETTQISERIDRQAENTNTRFDDLNRDMNKRFDEVNRELADQRERMAKLEGSLEGFLAGRRDRDAA